MSIIAERLAQNQENLFRNGSGIKNTLVNLLSQGKVDEAIELFADNNEKVSKAICEYNPDFHKITERPDKKIKNRPDYITHKIKENHQFRINEIELFFMLGQPLKWEMRNSVEEQEKLKPVFKLFMDFLNSQHYDSNNRIAKRLAGAETQCAKLYEIYKDEGVSKVKTIILSKSLGYDIRPLFNRYGDMKAFAVGYNLKNSKGEITLHWDIYTSESIYRCDRKNTDISISDIDGWIVKKEENILGKIPIIFFQQPKAWAGAESISERLEEMDSKTADIVDYTDNPILILGNKVNNGIPGAKDIGQVLQVNSKDDVVKYLEVPNQNETKQTERDNLLEQMHLATFTPDFTFKNVKGLGAISGSAITKSTILGHIKRLNRMEIYDEAFERDCSLIKTILSKYLYIDLRNDIMSMDIHHIYQNPSIGIDDNSEEISRWREIGGMSIESVVSANRNVQNKELEIERIKLEMKQQQENENSKNLNKE